MSREIRFRAWDKLTKEMVYDFTEVDDQFNSFFFSMDSEGELTISKEGKLMNKRFEPMQYTGLKDKNGKEIYRMDIVVHKGDNKVVCWDDKHLCHVLIWAHKYGEVARNGIVSNGGQKYTFKKVTANLVVEVIGNKFENPELLKKVDE